MKTKKEIIEIMSNWLEYCGDEQTIVLDSYDKQELVWILEELKKDEVQS